jgi:hypothetical protein
MKKRPPPTSETSALDKRDSTPGRLPSRINTVRSHVLASLLESNALTGMDAVFRQSTTRLSAVIYALENAHGWHIERREIATGTSDGRIETIAAYWLPQETIAKAFEAGARPWINMVKAARAERRKEAEKCKAKAAHLNASRKPQDPRQSNLWGNA